jgi:hypothetical protein
VQFVPEPGTAFVDPPSPAVADDWEELVPGPLATRLAGGACPQVFTSTVIFLALFPARIFVLYIVLLVVGLPPFVVVVEVTR